MTESAPLSAELLDQIRRDRANGELLGMLVDRYGAEATVAALGVRRVASALGVDAPVREYDDEADEDRHV